MRSLLVIGFALLGLPPAYAGADDRKAMPSPYEQGTGLRTPLDPRSLPPVWRSPPYGEDVMRRDIIDYNLAPKRGAAEQERPHPYRRDQPAPQYHAPTVLYPAPGPRDSSMARVETGGSSSIPLSVVLLALFVLGAVVVWVLALLFRSSGTSGAAAGDSTTAQRLAFERRAAAAEIMAARNPKGYRLRVVAFALLGYAVLWLLLALLLVLAGVGVVGAVSSTGMLVLLVKSKIGIALLAAIAILARALWVKLDPPGGLRIDVAAFPQLRDEIERLRAATAAPVVHEIVLTPDFNAAMVQTPRLGVFGWQRNSLVLGLQLLLALTPEQCRAVIAHELAHLSGRHARLAAWIYRVRESWRRTMIAFDQAGSWATRFLAGFFHWYAPAFAAYSFALARRNEYEADALGASASTNAAAGEALARARVLGEVIGQNYWKMIIERADHQADPERSFYSGLRRFLVQALPGREALELVLRRALTEETSFADTHPALRDRLAALGAAAEAPVPIVESAAQAWLGERLNAALDAFDVHWLQTNAEAWRNRFREAEKSRATLAALRERPEDGLTREERWQLATLGERFERERDPLPAYLAFKARFPNDREADFAIGRLLAERGDAGCMAHLESSSGVPSLARPSAEIAAQYLLRAGDKEAAERWRQRAESAYDIECLAMRERQSVSKDDEYIEPQLAPAVLEAMRVQLARVAEIKRAWIARKRTEYLPEHPVYVLAFEVKGWRPKEPKLFEAIARVLEAPGQTFFVRKGGDADAVADKVIRQGVALLP